MPDADLGGAADGCQQIHALYYYGGIHISISGS